MNRRNRWTDEPPLYAAAAASRALKHGHALKRRNTPQLYATIHNKATPRRFTTSQATFFALRVHEYEYNQHDTRNTTLQHNADLLHSKRRNVTPLYVAIIYNKNYSAATNSTPEQQHNEKPQLQPTVRGNITQQATMGRNNQYAGTNNT